MDLRFLRLRRWLLKQQPDKTVFNRFIENWYQIWFNLYDPATEDAIYDSHAISSISLLSAKALFCPRHSRGFTLVQPTEKPGTMDCSSQVFVLAESNRQEADCSYDFSIKWLTPFYPANPSQAAGSGEKCMDLRFLRCCLKN